MTLETEPLMRQNASSKMEEDMTTRGEEDSATSTLEQDVAAGGTNHHHHATTTTLETHGVVLQPHDEIVILCELVGASDLMRDDAENHLLWQQPSDKQQHQSLSQDVGDNHHYQHNNNNNSNNISSNNSTKLEQQTQPEEDDVMQAFATVKFGGKRIHKTLSAEHGGRNPIWTLSTKSLFLLETTPHALSKHKLDISLWSPRPGFTTVENVFLGTARLDGATILSSKPEQRISVELQDEDYISRGGVVTMRFRPAVPSDAIFIRNIYSQRSTNHLEDLYERDLGGQGQQSAVNDPDTPTALRQRSANVRHTESDTANNPKEGTTKKVCAQLPTEVDEAQIAGESLVNALSSAFATKSFVDKEGQVKYRTKPYADPQRIKRTEFLSKHEIMTETRKPSRQWIEAGSGRLGKLYLEILSCHDLPNTDVGESVGNLTDAFVAAVFEDAMVQTEVIDDELSPHWLPWSKRAFVFGIMHPASMLYLGCFDFDLGLSDHEKIGRVAVNICNLQRDTEYTLRYGLYPSSNVTERKSNGTITIRIRVEYHDEKAMVLSALQPRPKFHVNVRKEKSQEVLHYTCFGVYGDENETKFDLTVTRSYINEILEYKRLLGYAIVDTFSSLVFWRGQVRILGLWLPLHSLLFFVMAATLVERPQMLPAFSLLSVAWMFLATGTMRRQHPSPWYRCPSFWHFIEILQTGGSSLRMRRVAPMEGGQEAAAYEQYWKERIEKDIDAATRRREEDELLVNLANENIQTKMKADNLLIPIELLSKLGRWQGIIAKYCRYARLFKIIATWEESILSFWITACFLAAGLFALLLDWGFIMTWVGRILVWCFFGPHMRIVDAYFRSNKSQKDDKLLETAMETFHQKSKRALERNQDATKLKDVKCLLFGKFITLVPNFNLSRHYDRPLPQSFARVYKKTAKDQNGDNAPKTLAMSKEYVPGQQFFGTMVPRPNDAAIKFENQMSHLKDLAAATLKCMDEITEKRRRDRVERYDSEQEAMLPHSLGYELITLGNNDGSGLSSGDTMGTDLATSASLEVDEDAQVAVLFIRRRNSSFAAPNRQSVRLGYELKPFNTDENAEPWEHSIHVSNSNMLEVRSSSSRMAVRDNSESMPMADTPGNHQILQSKVSFVMDPLEALGVAELNCQLEDSATYEECREDESGDDGVEVVLQTIVEESDDEVDQQDPHSSAASTEENGDDGVVHDGEDGNSTVMKTSTKEVHVVLYKQQL